MKIKKVSTEQFAGIADKEIEFGEGVNVVYGKNESGKSTLVNLISAILFQNAEIDGRKDKDFKANAFPADRNDGNFSGDIANGIIILDSESDEYTLSKKWRKDNNNKAVSELKTPVATLENQDKITATLSKILDCDEGIYKEMLLSPQSSAAENLKKLLDGNGATNTALAGRVTQAFRESGDISVNDLENKINDAVFKLTGDWWNAENKRPKKSGYTERSKNLGEIMKAFIVLEEAEKESDKLKKSEASLDEALKNFSEKESAAQKAESELNEFEKYYDNLRTLKSNEDIILRCKNDIDVFNKALTKLPESRLALKKANSLKQEKDNRELLDRYNNAKKYHDNLQEIENKLSSISRPEGSEISALKTAEDKIRDLENKLRGMNIDAKIKMLGGNSVKITSILSGKEIMLDGENARISEAVRVEIPGIMEMELSPAEVNAAVINANIAENKKEMSDIFGKYSCKSIAEIEQLAVNYDKLLSEKAEAARNLQNAAASDFAELESCAGALADVREMSVIDKDISELCKGCDINQFIWSNDHFVKEFSEKYHSESVLKEQIEGRRAELEKAQKAVDNAKDMPEQYLKITDPEKHKKELQEAVEQARKDEKDALSQKASAQTELDSFIETHGDDLPEKCEQAKREYNEKIELLGKWLHIQEVFNQHKAALNSNPLESLAQKFEEYLGRISGDRVTAEFAEAGKPDFTVSSGNYNLDYVKLSDGTKETVFLAFRLAVLDYLFPNGGGVIVLDDPLNDMDISRVKQSCELIKENAEKHQIIFLTCREEYSGMLGGNLIHI